MPTPRTLDPTAAATHVGISRSSLYRLLKTDETFPRPVQLMPGRIAYLVTELDAWVDAKAASRSAA